MLPTELSAAGTMDRRDAKDLRNLLQKQPSEYHEPEADRFWGSLKYFTKALTEAQNDYHERLKQYEESGDLYHNAKTAASRMTERHAAQCTLVTSLTRQIISMSQPRTGTFPDQGWWARRFALVHRLSSAVEENAATFDHMETMQKEAERCKRWYQFYEKESKHFHERAEILWKDYEILTKEIEDVKSQVRHLWDEKYGCENEAGNEKAVVYHSQWVV